MCAPCAIMVSVLKASVPFIPITEAEDAHVKVIYGLKYPQNRLVQCWYIPGVDTSEPSWFIPLYLIQLYFMVLFVVVTSIMFLFPFILLHLIGQHIVLSYKLKCLGKSLPIWSKSFRKSPMEDNLKSFSKSHKFTGELQNDSSRNRWNRHQMKKAARDHDTIEVRHCIVFHQQLLRFRALLDSVTRSQINVRVLIMFSTLCFSSYPITLLTQFDLGRQFSLLIEFLLIFGYYYFTCFLSETLEWANCRLRRSIYQSKWYEMSPEAQRMVLMFLKRTQKPHYMHALGGTAILGNESFVKSLKTVYSFMRFVHISKK
ncbi:hypothetical protein WDU94_015172 [Cyamophila willieti]